MHTILPGSANTNMYQEDSKFHSLKVQIYLQLTSSLKSYFQTFNHHFNPPPFLQYLRKNAALENVCYKFLKRDNIPQNICKIAFIIYILILKVFHLAHNNLAFQASVIYCNICRGGRILEFSTTVFPCVVYSFPCKSEQEILIQLLLHALCTCGMQVQMTAQGIQQDQIIFLS